MTTLGAWLKGQGFTVDDDNVPLGRESTWRGVDFVMWHHTVSACHGSESSIASYCRTGGGGTYPPLCQIMLGNSGKVWMTCRERSGQKDPGRASHAGSGKGYGVANDTMNEHALGIEFQCDGKHPLATHAKQYETGIALTAALCRRYNVPVKNIIGHKEWSTTGKVDPRDDMDKVRADVAAKLKEDGMSNVYDYGFHGADSVLKVTGSYIPLVGASEWNPGRDGLQFGKLYFKVTGVKFKSGKTVGAVRVKCVRENPTDPTFYHDVVVHADALDSDGEGLHSFASFESGEHERNLHWEVKCIGGLDSCSLATSRYAGWATVGD